MTDNTYFKVARMCVKAATMPFPVNDDVVEIVKTVINEEQAKFMLKAFKKAWISEEEIQIKTDIDKELIRNMLDELTHIGIIINLPHPSTGVMHYKVVPFFPGLLEFTLMKGKKGEKQKKLAQQWEKVFNNMSEGTQKNYEKTVGMLKNYNIGTDRIVPVEKEVKSGKDIVMRLEDLEQVIENEDTIAVATCYCRHRKDLLGEPCKRTDHRENCIILGKAAEFCVQNEFAKPISKEDALQILKRAEDEGLVHKIFHAKLDPKAELDGICSCCPCCCGTFDMFLRGAIPAMSYSSYLAQVNKESCVSCGTCVEICPIGAIELTDTIATINEETCLGCGLCSHHCPEDAISLKRTGERLVFIPPPKIKS
ncbi:MAG: 4Fe-4S dicluster domain-containing protein [Candidatus Lokiarchaeota archaeon]|nr:4Fe-4S dicluster domain-containing protein [Candidatus Lokiarchaeota archaeon]